jgi:hypothetical protein
MNIKRKTENLSRNFLDDEEEKQADEEHGESKILRNK